jgi:hypothetical protein
MMRKLDQRGTAALEFGLVAVPFFFLMFAIFDIGRYAITVHSLKMLANAEARANMIECYTPSLLKESGAPPSPSGCTGGPGGTPYLTSAQQQNVAPFLYGPTLSTACTVGSGVTPPAGCAVDPKIPTRAKQLTVNASQSNFTVIMPFLAPLNNPNVSTSIPF